MNKNKFKIREVTKLNLTPGPGKYDIVLKKKELLKPMNPRRIALEKPDYV